MWVGYIGSYGKQLKVLLGTTMAPGPVQNLGGMKPHLPSSHIDYVSRDATLRKYSSESGLPNATKCGVVVI